MSHLIDFRPELLYVATYWARLLAGTCQTATIQREPCEPSCIGKATVAGAGECSLRSKRILMLLLNLINNFYDAIDLFDSHDMLTEAIRQICKLAGFDYFAIVHHAHVDPSRADLLRIHNYPPDFAAYHEAQGLGASDPVHRASQLRGTGFSWSKLSRLLRLTKSDHHVLDMARRGGIGDGYTVPFHLPGECSGSCSFAVRPDRCFPHIYIPLAQSLGSFAFEAALNLQRFGGASEQARTPIRLAPLV